MKYKYFIFLVFLSFLIGCAKSDKEANNHFRRAREFRSKGQFDSAMAEYRNIIYVYPKSLLVPKAAKLISECEKEIEISKTVSIADALIASKYNDAGLFILRNLIDKHPDAFIAEEIHKKINSLTDNQAENSLNIAMKLQKMGKFAEAKDSYEKFLASFPYSKEKDQIKIYISQCEEEISRQKVIEEQQIKQAELERKRAEEEKRKRELELAEKEKHQKEIKKKQSIEDALKALKEKTK